MHDRPTAIAPAAVSAAATPPQLKLGGARAWIVWALGAASFGYAFFQRVAPSVIVQDLMREFAVGAAILGNLSALYLYAYASLQIPIGVLIDRFGPRLLISLALLIAALGSAIFSFAQTIEIAYAGRLLIGVGCSVGFVGTLLLVSRWFPPHRYAMLSGLTMLVAMASGIGSQAPLALLVELIGWRQMLLLGAALGVVLALSIGLFVRNHPAGSYTAKPNPDWRSIRADLKIVLHNRQVWNAGVIAAMMSAPMLAFGGLWGVPYLMERYSIERPEAALYSSFIFLGWALGSPFGGWLADALQRRKGPLVSAAGINLIALALLFFGPDVPALLAAGLIFVAGAAGGVMVNCYAYAREITPRRVDGAVTGFINTFSVGSGALFQPIIGLLLDIAVAPAPGNGPAHYLVSDFTYAFTSLFTAATIALCCTLCMRETRCRAFD